MMLVILKVKDTDNIIGLKEDIATRLEAVADVLRIDVVNEQESEGAIYGKLQNETDTANY